MHMCGLGGRWRVLPFSSTFRCLATSILGKSCKILIIFIHRKTVAYNKKQKQHKVNYEVATTMRICMSILL